jgi:hypothetical protein
MTSTRRGRPRSSCTPATCACVGRWLSISAVFFQNLPEFRCQALVFIRITPFHCSQVGDHLFRPLRSLTSLNRVDVIPQLSELPDRPGTKRPGRLFPDQFIKDVHDTAELLAITMRRNNFPLCIRRAGILLSHVNAIRKEPAGKDRLTERLRSKRGKRTDPGARSAPRPGPPCKPFCRAGYRIHEPTIRSPARGRCPGRPVSSRPSGLCGHSGRRYTTQARAPITILAGYRSRMRTPLPARPGPGR